jgi:hypothetical protein
VKAFSVLRVNVCLFAWNCYIFENMNKSIRFIHVYIIHPSINLCIHLLTYQSIDSLIYRFVYLSIYIFIHLSIYLSICLSLYLSIYIYASICSSIHLSIHVSIHLFIHLFFHRSIYLFIYLSYILTQPLSPSIRPTYLIANNKQPLFYSASTHAQSSELQRQLLDASSSSSHPSSVTYDSCTCCVVKPHATKDKQFGLILDHIIAQV